MNNKESLRITVALGIIASYIATLSFIFGFYLSSDKNFVSLFLRYLFLTLGIWVVVQLILYVFLTALRLKYKDPGFLSDDGLYFSEAFRGRLYDNAINLSFDALIWYVPLWTLVEFLSNKGAIGFLAAFFAWFIWLFVFFSFHHRFVDPERKSRRPKSFIYDILTRIFVERKKKS